MKLGEVCRIRTGKLDANASSKNGKYPFFTCSKKELRIDTYSYDCECVLVAGNGDLNVKYYKGKFDAYQRTYIIEVENKKKLNTKFLYLLLTTKIEELRNHSIGGVIKYIKLGNLMNIEIPNLSITKQRQIVSKLFKMEEIIELKKNQIQVFDEIIKLKFIEMFGNPTDNCQKKYKLSMTEICEIIDGDRGKKYPKQEDFFSEEYCLFLNTKNVTPNGFDFSNNMYITKEKDKELRNGKLKVGDIVLTTRGTVGNLAFYTKEIPYENIRINSGMVILRLDKSKVKIANGSAQPQLPISKMNHILIMVPPLELQNKFSEIVKTVNQRKLELKNGQKELEKMKFSLIQKYFR